MQKHFRQHRGKLVNKVAFDCNVVVLIEEEEKVENTFDAAKFKHFTTISEQDVKKQQQKKTLIIHQHIHRKKNPYPYLKGQR